MALDLIVELIRATVAIDQPQGDGTRTVGTGFLVQAPRPDGAPRVVLVTADHVLKSMPGDEARLGWRMQEAEGAWKFQPQRVKIRDGSKELWTRNPSRDIAVMEIQAPESFARAAIPLAWLADHKSFEKYGVGPGDEMMVLGYPEGLSSNTAGFPILRYGRVASYPLSPVAEFPSFLLDLNVFKGNSGGPVFLTKGLRRGPDAPSEDPPQLVTGMTIRETTVGGRTLDIGVVLHAAFVREAIASLDAPVTPTQPAAAPPPANRRP